MAYKRNYGKKAVRRKKTSTSKLKPNSIVIKIGK